MFIPMLSKIGHGGMRWRVYWLLPPHNGGKSDFPLRPKAKKCLATRVVSVEALSARQLHRRDGCKRLKVKCGRQRCGRKRCYPDLI